MRLYVQWARVHPTDWEPVEIVSDADWHRLPSKPVPTGTETLDDQPGWLYDLNVQGVTFGGFDHVAVGVIPNGVRVTSWNDDAQDDSEKIAMVWEFEQPRHDPRVGQVNTVQRLTVHDDTPDSRWVGQSTSVGPVIVRPWSEFVPPTGARHGVWLPSPHPITPASVNERHRGIFRADDGPAAHRAARAFHGWEEWRS